MAESEEVPQFKRQSQVCSVDRCAVEVKDGSDKYITRWRRIGESKGSSAGGGCDDVNAVGRHASSGGRRVCGFGAGIVCFMVCGVSCMPERFVEEILPSFLRVFVCL